jgi:hypothetical protein
LYHGQQGIYHLQPQSKDILNQKLAKSEVNDCVVRAIASADWIWIMIPPTNLLKKLSREKMVKVLFFGTGMNMLSKNGKQINGKDVQIISEEHNTMLYYVVVKGVKKLREQLQQVLSLKNTQKVLMVVLLKVMPLQLKMVLLLVTLRMVKK